MTQKMYAVDEALLNEFREAIRRGDKYPSASSTIHTFAAITRRGTVSEIREFVFSVRDHNKMNGFSWYPDMSILVTCGHEKLARELRSRCNDNENILSCVYNNYGLDVTKKWVEIVDPRSYHVVPLITHLAEIGRIDDIDELIDDFPDIDRNSLRGICQNLPAAKIIAAMAIKNSELPSWHIGVRGDIDVYRRYIYTYGDDEIYNIIGGAINGGSSSLVEFLMVAERKKMMKYLSTRSIGSISHGENEAVTMMLYDNLCRHNMDWISAIKANQMTTLRRVIADRRDCYTGDVDRKVTPTSGQVILRRLESAAIMINLLSMSHPPAISGMIRMLKDTKTWAGLRERFKEIVTDDGIYENIYFADIAPIVAWRPMIALTGRWSAVASPFLVDVVIIAMLP